MNSFADRFAEVMRALNMTKAAEFARLLDVAPQNVHSWVKVRERIGTDSRILFQKKTGISFDWLNDGLGEMWLPSRDHPHKTYPYPANLTIRESLASYSKEIPDFGYTRLRLMDGSGSRGQGSVNDDFPEVLKQIDIAEWQVRQQLGFVPKDDRVQLLTVRGNSNYPKIKNGDVVMVDISQTIFSGDDFYLINMHGFALIKRLQIMADGLHINSTNPEYECEVVAPKQMHDVIITGKIVGFAQFRRSEEI